MVDARKAVGKVGRTAAASLVVLGSFTSPQNKDLPVNTEPRAGARPQTLKATQPAPQPKKDLPGTLVKALGEAGRTVEDLIKEATKQRGEVIKAFAAPNQAMQDLIQRAKKGSAPRYGTSAVPGPHQDPSLKYGVRRMKPEGHQRHR